ncbi:hypothetical protein R5R35_004334 [Gryllus longicercus]|uniref:Uncharacterized protein n=1 Tax=Gryllus longicercus TaxID=2509291 RepID=A0AAN9VSK9_9ORTH
MTRALEGALEEKENDLTKALMPCTSGNTNDYTRDMSLPFRQTDDDVRTLHFNAANASCTQVKNSVVFIYKSKKTSEPWEMLIKKMDASTIRLNMLNLPRGLFFEITDINLIASELYKKSAFVATLHHTYDVFLPTRFTPEIEAIGKENFLAERPHMSFVGINPKNKAYIVLIYKLDDLWHHSTWDKLFALYRHYGLLD